MPEPSTRDLAVSLTRTIVATAVGTAVAYLARTAHLVIDDATSVGLVQVFTAAVIGGYYLIVRSLESRFPAVGWLLGLAKQPAYPPSGDSASGPPAVR